MRRNLYLLIVLALLAVACGGDDDAADETTSTTVATTTSTSVTTTSSTSTTTTVPEPAGTPSPINGLPVTDDLDRRVLAVKIDNHCQARPQSGIEAAEAVFEVKVEASFTRFIALFHHSDSEYLGPIRSGRPTDPALLRPVDAMFAISGAQDWIARVIVGAGVPLLGEDDGMFRIGERRSPHNLYADTEVLRAAAISRGYADDPPPPMFDFGEWQGGEPAGTVTLDWHSGNASIWDWDGARWLRTIEAKADACFDSGPHEWVDSEGEGAQIAVDTHIVIYGTAYVASPPGAGTAVPAIDTVGSNTALLFHQGEVIEGVWRRQDITEPFSFETIDGDPLLVPPGQLWVSVIPDTRPVTWE